MLIVSLTGSRTARASLCAAVLSFGVLLSAPPASAEPIDDAFTAALAKQGIDLDRNTAIAMGHTVCAGFDQNEKSSVLAMRLVKTTDLTLKQSSFFVGVSIAAYCPQYKGRTDDSLRWLLPFPPLM